MPESQAGELGWLNRQFDDLHREHLLILSELKDRDLSHELSDLITKARANSQQVLSKLRAVDRKVPDRKKPNPQ